MKENLAIAIIGTGFIGEVHARAARRAGASVVAVGASTPERSQQAAHRLKARRTVNSPDELANASDIDVVHVCAPNTVHADYVEAALTSGKHVVCEKPLASEFATATYLTQLARGAGLIATVPYVYRFYATVRHARAMVQRGDTGPLHLIHGSYLQDWMSRPDDWSWRVDPELGGPSRAMADIGSHWCDLVEFVSGHRITRLVARLSIVFAERMATEHTASFQRTSNQAVPRRVETEDAALMMFETDHGATGSVVVSQVSPGRKNRLWFELDGSSLAIAFDQEHPEALWIGGRDRVVLQARDPEQLAGQASHYSFLPPGHPQGYADCFDLFVADTYQAILGNDVDGLPTFDDGLRSVCLIESILESQSTQSWVEVKQP